MVLVLLLCTQIVGSALDAAGLEVEHIDHLVLHQVCVFDH